MKWVACAESAVEIFANGQVRLSGRATRRARARVASAVALSCVARERDSCGLT